MGKRKLQDPEEFEKQYGGPRSRSGQCGMSFYRQMHPDNEEVYRILSNAYIHRGWRANIMRKWLKANAPEALPLLTESVLYRHFSGVCSCVHD